MFDRELLLHYSAAFHLCLALQLDDQRAQESGPTVCGKQPRPRDQHVCGPRPLQARLQGRGGGWQYRREHPGDGL